MDATRTIRGISERLPVGWRIDAVLGAALVLLAFMVYSNAFDHGFLLNWDDLDYVVENEAVRGLTWNHVVAAFTQSFVGNWAPLHVLSYAVDHALWGLRPAGFHLTNVVLHALNGLLLYALVRRLGVARGGAAAGAALFLAHPVQVESVAWVSQRKNVLCMTFFLVAIHAYASYRLSSGARRARSYAASLVSAAAALATKAIAVVLAPVLALFDVCFEPKARRPALLDKVPFVVTAAAVALVTISTQSSAITAGRAVYGMGALTTAYTMVPVVVRYLGMLVWPSRLSAVYTPSIHATPDATFIVSAAAIGVLVLVGAWLFRHRRELFFWYTLFFVALLPVIQIIPLPTLMNDRYLYFPMIGISALFGSIIARPLSSGRKLVRVIALGSTVLVISALAVVAHARCAVWRDDVSLWSDVTVKSPDNALGWNGLGRSLLDAGNPDGALRALRRALELDPDFALALNNMGILYNQHGLPAMGRPYLLRALRAAPEDFDATMNLGYGYLMEGDLDRARTAFRGALGIQPQSQAATAALREVLQRSRAKPN